MSERWEYGAGAEEPEGAEGPGERGGRGGRGRAGTDDEGVAEVGGVQPFPWPPAESAPVLPAFAETWKAATFDPGSFFARVPRSHGTGPALLYYLAIVVLVAGATLFWDSLSLFTGGFEDSALADELGVAAVSPVVGFLLTPAILVAMLFVSAGISHAILALVNGARHTFGTTVRVFCYAYSPAVLGVVPIIGGLVGAIWMVVLLIIGLREAHETETWRSAVAILLPFVLLMGLLLLSFLMLVAAGAAILGGASL